MAAIKDAQTVLRLLDSVIERLDPHLPDEVRLVAFEERGLAHLERRDAAMDRVDDLYVMTIRDEAGRPRTSWWVRDAIPSLGSWVPLLSEHKRAQVAVQDAVVRVLVAAYRSDEADGRSFNVETTLDASGVVASYKRPDGTGRVTLTPVPASLTS